MADLGTFGVVKPVGEPDTFTYFGVTVRTNRGVTDLHWADFMARAAKIEANDPDGQTLVKDFVALVIHAEDFERFWRLALDNGQELDDVLPVVQAVVSREADRPTGRPSGSTDGPSQTLSVSADGTTGRALQLLDGRPDLQSIVLSRREYLAG